MTTAILVAYYYPPENTSGAARPSRFARFLPDFGFSPVVLAGADGDRARYASPHANGPDVVRVSSALENSISCRFQTGVASGFQRFLLPYEEHVPWIPAAVAAGMRVAAQSGAKVVFSTSPPIANHLVAWRLKQRLGLRWVADFRDPLVGNPFRTSRRARKYDPWIEAIIVRHADAVIANTDHLADQWAARYPQHRDKISTIWNGFDPAEQLPVIATRPPRKPHLLTHVGALYGHRHPSRLLYSLRRLLQANKVRNDEISIHLTGPVENVLEGGFQSILDELRTRGIMETNFTQVPRSAANLEIASADSLLLLDLNASGTGVQVPAKLFDYVRAGKPILAFTARGSAVEQILGRSGLQHVFLYNDDPDDALDQKILDYFKTPFDWWREPSDWFLSQFDGRRQTATLSRVLQPAR